MVDAPERIWADLNMGIWLGAPQPDRRPAPPTEYIRADIAERQLAERKVERDAARKAGKQERTRVAELERENTSLLETVTRKVNEKIEAERQLAEARAERDAADAAAKRHYAGWKAQQSRAETAEAERDEFERSLISQAEATVAAQAQSVAADAERDRVAAEVTELRTRLASLWDRP